MRVVKKLAAGVTSETTGRIVLSGHVRDRKHGGGTSSRKEPIKYGEGNDAPRSRSPEKCKNQNSGNDTRRDED